MKKYSSMAYQLLYNGHRIPNKISDSTFFKWIYSMGVGGCKNMLKGNLELAGISQFPIIFFI